MDLITRLKPFYLLGLLSNTNKWHFDYGIRKTEVFKLFDAVTLSFEVGTMKPDPRIYHNMLTKLDMNADVCVYIDDLQENVDAAQRVGMLGIHYTSYGSLVLALQGLGIRMLNHDAH